MVQNITPPAPPSALITIQPITTPVANQDAAPNLQNLPNGTLVEGFVVNRDNQQNPILRTAVGDVLVKSEFFLKTGSEVVFKIDASIASRARIVSIDGMNPQDYASKVAVTPQTGDEVMSSSLMSGARPLTASGAQPPVVLQALLLSPNVMPTESLPPAVAQYWSQIVASLQKDASVAIKIITTQLPLPGDPVEQTTQQIAVQTPVAPAAVKAATQPQQLAGRPEILVQPMQPQPQTTTTAQNTPVNTTVITTTSQSVAQPVQTVTVNAAAAATVTQTLQRESKEQRAPTVTQPNAPAQAATVVPRMTAHVIGHEFSGENIIQTPIGTFKLMTAQPLPTGSKLTVEITPENKLPTATPLPLLPTDLDEFTSLARDWNSLREAISTIAAFDPNLATQIINNAMPKAHAKMTSEMLFLFAAIKSGNVEQWFGKRAIEILDMRSPEMLKRLNKDFAQLQQVFSDALPQWMSVVVPFYSESQMQQIRMYFKHDDESGSRAGDAGGQRFIIELDMSQLGDMQFDGFIKKSNEKAKHFDLIVRSARPLPGEVEQGIRGIFEQSLQVTGYKGYVNFQQGIQHFVRPLEDVKEALAADSRTIIA